MRPRKLILCVIDALAPAMLDQAVAEGLVPTLASLIERGRYVDRCVAAFPSVTPVCAAAITTGAWQDRTGIPGMNWYDRARERYVEYGSSLRAAQRFGITRQLTDTVYNLNQAHLAADPPTIFERLDDAGLRTAGTTYLVYRGRHVHEPRRQGLLTRVAAPLMRHPAIGPRELFYADIFASRPAPCTSMLGMPGVRDRHSGCVGAYLVEKDLFDFLLLSLPDNDWHSHKHGPAGQPQALALADAQLRRLADAAGGIDELLAEYAVIVMGDHSQVPIRRTIALASALEDVGVLPPRGSVGSGARIAVCPSQRAAMIYVLDGPGEGPTPEALARRALDIEGVELACRLERDRRGAPDTAVVTHAREGELRFAPGGEASDRRGSSWSVEGRLEVLRGTLHDDRLRTPRYPDALARVWAALTCEQSGEVVLSAAAGYEFLDWGAQAHAGGGSHGSLRAGDSLTGLILCGMEGSGERSGEEPAEWTLCDVVPLVLAHFGISAAGGPAGTAAAAAAGTGSA
jgi:hypothetical protein